VRILQYIMDFKNSLIKVLHVHVTANLSIYFIKWNKCRVKRRTVFVSTKKKKMHCKCKAEIRCPIIDHRILHVLDIICKMQCFNSLTTAFRSFLNRKSFHHISASVLVNF
jgi:hypothetical protein